MTGTTDNQHRLTTQTTRVAHCRLRATAQQWPFAAARAGEIARHWQQVVAANPAYFNGDIMLLSDWSIVADGLSGGYLRSTFAAYLA